MNLANIYVGDCASAKEALKRSVEKARVARDHFMANRLSNAISEIERAEVEHMDKSIANFRRLGYVEIPASLDNRDEYEKICEGIYNKLDECAVFLRDWCRLIEDGVPSPVAVLKCGRRVSFNEMHKNDVLGILKEIREEKKKSETK